MKEEITAISVCSRCDRTYIGHPAISREDGKTLICPDCGIREALESMGVSEAEQEMILDTIHRHAVGERPE